MRMLLVNDDGPPSAISPHVLGLWETLQSKLGWKVSVVLPSSQKSWGSMAFTIQNPIGIWYYYPLKGNFDGRMEGTKDSWSTTRRSVGEHELGEWVLLDGSPTTCANAGLYNLDALQPSEEPEPFDLVISGPNFGRNSGTAFSLSSGTIGAALAASLSGTRAISLSYGHFQVPSEEMKAAETKYKRVSGSIPSGQHSKALPSSAPDEVVTIAHSLSCRIIDKLYRDWEEGVGVYTINVPLSYILKEEVVYWTTTWSSRYGQLFKLANVSPSTDIGGTFLPSSAPTPAQQLRFGPNMIDMMQPRNPPEGTDIWAIMKGYVSVSRLEGRYAEVEAPKSSQGRFKL